MVAPIYSLWKNLDLMSKCSGCENWVSPAHAYCSSCGNANPNFDESKYEGIDGMAYCEAKEAECAQGHPQSMAFQSGCDHPIYYCSLCGAYIKKSVSSIH